MGLFTLEPSDLGRSYWILMDDDDVSRNDLTQYRYDLSQVRYELDLLSHARSTSHSFGPREEERYRYLCEIECTLLQKPR